MKIKVLLVVVLIVSLITFTACSQDSGEELADPEDIEEPESGEEDQNNEEDQNTDIEEPEEQGNEDESSDIEIEVPEGEEIIIDTGTYVGQVDNNHIEIKISGVPEEIGTKVFKLDIEKIDDFEENISLEDEVKFKYYLNEDEVGVIVSIEEIEN